MSKCSAFAITGNSIYKRIASNWRPNLLDCNCREVTILLFLDHAHELFQ